jgi:hypothetical protein
MTVAIENRGLRKWVLAGKVARPGESVTLTDDERAELGGRSPAALTALADGELVETRPEQVRISAPDLPADEGAPVPSQVKAEAATPEPPKPKGRKR